MDYLIRPVNHTHDEFFTKLENLLEDYHASIGLSDISKPYRIPVVYFHDDVKNPMTKYDLTRTLESAPLNDEIAA